MKNFYSEGHHVDHTPSSAVLSGAVVLIGTRVGVAVADIQANTPGALRVTGNFFLPKKAGDTPAQGAALYWDNTNKYLTTTSSGNTYAGWAVAAALSGDATVSTKINN
jgi:predicted RecA/RadA family phage recombinase